MFTWNTWTGGFFHFCGFHLFSHFKEETRYRQLCVTIPFKKSVSCMRYISWRRMVALPCSAHSCSSEVLQKRDHEVDSFLWDFSPDVMIIRLKWERPLCSIADALLSGGTDLGTVLKRTTRWYSVVVTQLGRHRRLLSVCYLLPGLIGCVWWHEKGRMCFTKTLDWMWPWCVVLLWCHGHGFTQQLGQVHLGKDGFMPLMDQESSSHQTEILT